MIIDWHLWWLWWLWIKLYCISSKTHTVSMNRRLLHGWLLQKSSMTWWIGSGGCWMRWAPLHSQWETILLRVIKKEMKFTIHFFLINNKLIILLRKHTQSICHRYYMFAEIWNWEWIYTVVFHKPSLFFLEISIDFHVFWIFLWK